MKQVLLVCLLAVVALSFTLQGTELSHPSKDLQFSDYTGAGVTQALVNSFVNAANSASSFYKDDVKANAEYIKKQLDTAYGSSSSNFFVLIQTQEIRFSWLVWVTTQNVIFSRRGINRVNPDWSYLVILFFAPPTSPDYAFVSGGNKGSGIDADTEALINEVVNTYEDDGDCDCDVSSVVSIGYGLINGMGRAWSTVCDANGITGALVYAVDGLWISAKPKNCWYTFYVSQ